MAATSDHATGEGIDAFVVVQLVELLLAFVATALVLPALSRNHQRFRRERVARHALFLSVVFSDWLFATVGVVHHIALVGEGGEKALTRSVAGVVLNAFFQMAFVATLVWPPILACFALRQGSASFFVRLNWQFAWLIAGLYGALWTRALQRDRSERHWNVVTYVLSAVLVGSPVLVLGVAAMLYAWQAGFLGKTNGKREIHEIKLLQYLLVTTALQLPFGLSTWIGGSFPHVLSDVAFCIVLLIPTINAYNYGSPATLDLMQDKRARSRTAGATHTSDADELIQSMDPDNLTLEELDGLSDMVFLAEGAAGSVYKARWLGIDVAMKLIKLPNAGDNHDLYQTIIQNSEAAFLAEASICARLRHPNITLFIRAGHFEGKLGILTEFCQHGSLKDVLKKQFPLAWKRKVSLALDVAKGLTYLHARNPTYIHRDLKASNILVTDTWQGKLADFGISKVSNFVRGQGDGQSARGGTVVRDSVNVEAHGGGDFDPSGMTMRTLNEATSFAGTWRWNAPEVLHDPTNCRYSRSTDMYSFGMVLWEILSDGAVPFSDVRFDFEVRERVICDQRPQIQPSVGCPDAFVALLQQCWAQKPSVRPTAPQAAAQLTLILESMDSKSMDRGSEQSSIFTDMSVRSTLAMRITNFFRGGASQRATTSSRMSSARGLGSSRGFASSRGLFGRSGGPSEVSIVDEEDASNKFAILGSPSSTASRSTTSSTRSSGFSYHVADSSRRRGFSRETALPSLEEYDTEASISDSSAAANAVDPSMSPIVELPMDAMLEDGGHHTFIEDKLPSESDLSVSYALDRDSERADHGPAERSRGLTFESNRSGDSVVDASPFEPEFDELVRTLPVKYPSRIKFPSTTTDQPKQMQPQGAPRTDPSLFI